ncbi:hypothetical protein PHMEG_0004751 [Phytophthora megakarya]|uniref:Uncharacterized protein n=1 Tax=Phytophthora megakarya TaxID=4795 RepID=A0A225WT26_9STRA|nr:hypothetical protein PHMEG_0004751 [Phytophthora megakarya]
MQARRETHREKETFLEHLHGRSDVERKCLYAEHRAYLGGERATDTDFGPLHDQAAATSIRVRTPIQLEDLCKPPMGKDAAYVAASKRLGKRVMALLLKRRRQERRR